MVVLAASIINKSGKALVSRQFVNVSRTLIEGYLGAFPKLIGTGKSHIFIETESVRYVYQPLESLYLILVTDKQGNIFQDLETLGLLSKLVTEYALSLDEYGVGRAAFDIIFAFDEVISLGHKEDVTFTQVIQYFDVQSDKERLYKMATQSMINDAKDVMKRKVRKIDKSKIEKVNGEIKEFMPSMGLGRIDNGSGSDLEIKSFYSNPEAIPKGPSMQLGRTQESSLLESLTDPVTFIFNEKLNITLKQDGSIGNYDVQGSLSLHILNKEDSLLQVQTEIGSVPSIQFEIHPRINKELFYRKHILCCKDPNRPFSIGIDGVDLLKWRYQIRNKSDVPLSIICTTSISGNETCVSLRYKALKYIKLHNVVISIPLLNDAPKIKYIHGEWRYDSRKSILEWSISFINNDNRRAGMGFVIPGIDTPQLYPILVCFTSSSYLVDIQITDVFPVRGGKPPEFSKRAFMSTENYRIV